MTTNDQMTLEIRLTQPGFDLLRAELAHLVDVVRPEALDRLHGAYHRGMAMAARRSPTHSGRRIASSSGSSGWRNSCAVRLITDAELRSDRVAVGHRVDVLRADGRERSYVLVSPPQADPRAGRLSSKSPLGDALLGGAVGDVVVLESNGEQITIVSVAPGDDWRAG